MRGTGPGGSHGIDTRPPPAEAGGRSFRWGGRRSRDLIGPDGMMIDMVIKLPPNLPKELAGKLPDAKQIEAEILRELGEG